MAEEYNITRNPEYKIYIKILRYLSLKKKKTLTVMDEIAEALSVKGYKVIRNQSSGYCFDMFAYMPDTEDMLMIKRIEELDKLKQGFLDDLKKMFRVFNVTPIVIGDKTKDKELEDGIVLSKRGIPLVTEETFYDMIRGEDIPLVFVSKGGVYVKLNSERLRRKREELGLSLGDIAYKLGASRRTVFAYERGDVNVTLAMAMKIEKILGDEIFERLSVRGIRELVIKNISGNIERRDKRSVRDKALLKMLDIFDRLGFLNFIFKRTPFKLASTKDYERSRVMIKKVNLKDLDKEENRLVFLLANITGSKAVFLVHDKKSSFEMLNENIVLIPTEKIEKEDEDIIKEILAKPQN